ncbi:MAG: hypothetical protein M1827_001020, partial [Pycnora praestabilis]
MAHPNLLKSSFLLIFFWVTLIVEPVFSAFAVCENFYGSPAYPDCLDARAQFGHSVGSYSSERSGSCVISLRNRLTPKVFPDDYLGRVRNALEAIDVVLDRCLMSRSIGGRSPVGQMSEIIVFQDGSTYDHDLRVWDDYDGDEDSEGEVEGAEMGFGFNTWDEEGEGNAGQGTSGLGGYCSSEGGCGDGGQCTEQT